MNSNNQQAYDRGVSVFSPDGRIYQVEYAREAVQRGAPSIGICADNGVVLAGLTETPEPLRDDDGIEKIHKVDNNIAVASTGHVADGRKLVDQLRVLSRQEDLRYGEEVTVDVLSRQMADHIQESTQVGGRRPYGAGLIVGGVTNGEPSLCEIEPGGTPSEWHAVAIGNNQEDCMEALRDSYEPSISVDDGVSVALEALSAAVGDLDAKSVDVATVTVEEPLQTLSNDTLEEYLADITEA